MTASPLLDRFASGGLASVNVVDFHLVAQECTAWWHLTQDVRYYFVSRWFAMVGSWWAEHDESGGVPVQLAQELEALLMSSVSRVLSDNIPADQALDLASHVSEKLTAKLSDSGDWQARGLVKPSSRGTAWRS